jgi:hypothetical protein
MLRNGDRDIGCLRQVEGLLRPEESRRSNVHDRDGIVIEHRRYIFRGELVGCVTNEKTCLSDSTVTDDNAPR